MNKKLLIIIFSLISSSLLAMENNSVPTKQVLDALVSTYLPHSLVLSDEEIQYLIQKFNAFSNQFRTSEFDSSAQEFRNSTIKKSFSCDWENCKHKYQYASGLSRHKTQTHSAKKGYTCHCKKEFRLRTDFRRHMLTHSNERPFTCRYSDCNKTFKTPSNRNFHEKVAAHTNNRKNFII